MFPNPQDALPLPPHPSLERYRKLAKELVKACRSGEIRAWAERWVSDLARLSGITARIDPWVGAVEAFAGRRLAGTRTCALADAQFVIARSHGFDSWPKFAKYLDAFERADSSAPRFEAAADAIVEGDAATLRKLLDEDPELIRARSPREHRATLLHYVAANGVENWRQRTPPNVATIATILLDAGAEVDATAEMYGGGCTALGLAATSVHPVKAGVQEALLQTLLDRGADLHQPVGGRRQPIVISCLANGRDEAAAFLAGRGAPVDFVAAAALGRIDVVREAFDRDGRDGRTITPEELNEAFKYACEYGAMEVVELLIAKGMDPAAPLSADQTPLHWAVIGGQFETVKLLLRHDPPLEARNVYGGTVLGQAAWSAAHGGDPETFAAIIETLIAAGAQVPKRHVPVNPRIDEVLRRHGSEAEPSWSWEDD